MRVKRLLLGLCCVLSAAPFGCPPAAPPAEDDTLPVGDALDGSAADSPGAALGGLGDPAGEQPVRVEVSVAGGDEPWLRLHRLDGSYVEYFGPRDGDTPVALEFIRLTQPDGTSSELVFNGASLPSVLRTSSGSGLRFEWESPRRGFGTLFDRAGNDVSRFAFDLDQPTMIPPELLEGWSGVDDANGEKPLRRAEPAESTTRTTRYSVFVEDCNQQPVANLGSKLQLVFVGGGQMRSYTPVWNGQAYTLTLSRPVTTLERLEDACTTVTDSDAWDVLCELRPAWLSVCASAQTAALLSPIPIIDEAAVFVPCVSLGSVLGFACFGPEGGGNAPSLGDFLCEGAEELISIYTERAPAWLDGAEVYAIAAAEGCGTTEPRESEHVPDLPGNDLVTLNLDLCPRFERHSFDLRFACEGGAVSAQQSQLPFVSAQNGITVARQVRNPDGGQVSTEIEGPAPLQTTGDLRRGSGAVDNVVRRSCDRFGGNPVERIITEDTTAHSVTVEEAGRGLLKFRTRSDVLLTRTRETLRPATPFEAGQLAGDPITCNREQVVMPFTLSGRHEVRLRPGEGLVLRARVNVGAEEGQTGGRLQLRLRPTLLGGIAAGPEIALCAARPAPGVAGCTSEPSNAPDVLLTFEGILRSAGLLQANQAASGDQLDCLGVTVDVTLSGGYAIDDLGIERGLMEAEWELEVTPPP